MLPIGIIYRSFSIDGSIGFCISFLRYNILSKKSIAVDLCRVADVGSYSTGIEGGGNVAGTNACIC